MKVLQRLTISLLNSSVKCCRNLSTKRPPRHKGSVIVEKRGSITCIGINRPDKKNAMNFDVACRISDALSAAEEDDEVKVAVLYGEKGNFCSGYDEEELKKDPSVAEKMRNLELTERFMTIPTVAAVSGFAQGPGFELALWCDFRIVEEAAIMGGFSKQIGLPMSERTAFKLTSILGFNKSLDWILTGRVVKGQEAFNAGVANRLVAIGTGLGEAVRFAMTLSNMPEACLKADRASIYLASDKSSRRTKQIIEHERDKMRKMALEDFREQKFPQVNEIRKRC